MRQKEILLLFILMVLLSGFVSAYPAKETSDPYTAPDITDVLGMVPLPFEDPDMVATVPGAMPEDQERLISSKPLFFIENQGQSSAEVLFEVVSDGGIVFFTSDGAIIRVIRSVNDELVSSTIGFTYDGVSETSPVKGLDPLPCNVNFMRGDPSQWITGVRTYRAISYPDLYPGVDLIYEGRSEGIKSIFRAKPGSNPEFITTEYFGHEDLAIASDGTLLIRTDAGTLTQSAPYCYQEIDGKEVRIPASFILVSENKVGFRFGEYDREKDLIIDPVIQYSLYLRGVGFADANGVAADSQRYAYITGTTFPAPFDANETQGGETDAVIVKISPDGTWPEYVTYIGGNGYDTGNGISVDSDGNAYVTGSTNSTTGFPVINGIQSANAGQTDAFALKLNRNGTALVYSTYIGGTGQDFGYGITIDPARNAYITGTTYSKVFPIAHGPQNTTQAGNSDAFAVKINTNGTQFLYSEYIGGLLYENGYGIAVDNAGNAYITGETNSRNFPVKNAFQPSFGGYNDAFITKLAPDGHSFVYSTYLGGSDLDTGRAIAVDGAGYAHVTGLTKSKNFPTQSAFIPENPGLISSFYTRLQPTGSALSLSTYLTGPGFDEGRGVAIDASGNVYVTGITKAKNLATINAFQPVYGGGVSDAFVAKFVPGQNTPEFLSYLGGNGKDEGHAIAIDNVCGVYIAGLTRSTDFPTVAPYPPAFLPKEEGGFITMVRDGECCPAPVADFTFVLPDCTEILTVRFTDTSTNSPGNWSWTFGDGSSSALQNPDHTYTAPGPYTVNLTVRKTCINSTVLTSTISKQFTVNLETAPVANFTTNPSSGTAPLTVQFNDSSTRNPVAWTWEFGDGSGSNNRSPTHTYISPGTYSVNLTAANRCGNDSVTKLVNVTVCPLPVADFTANPSSGTAPLTVRFNDTSSNNPFNWSWEFGNGAVSFEQNPQYTYISPDTYQVNLTVRNECGNDSIIKQITVLPPVTTPTTCPTTIITTLPTTCPSPCPTTIITTLPTTVPTTEPTTVPTTTVPTTCPTTVPTTEPTTVPTTTVPTTIPTCPTTPPTTVPTTCVTTVPTTEPTPYPTNIVPPLPHAFYGEIMINGEPAEAGTIITAVTTGGGGSVVTVTDGMYGSPDTFGDKLVVQGLITSGAPVAFYADGARAECYDVMTEGPWMLTYPFKSGEVTELDLRVEEITIDEPPVADFVADKTSGPLPLFVSYTDTSTNSPTSWLWDFGDGNISSGQNPVHTYTSPGSYTVNLTAANAAGSGFVTKNTYILVTEPGVTPPAAEFVANVTQGIPPLAVGFTDLSSNTPTSWAWNFGDGFTSTEQDPIHSYTSGGNYTVVLTATNAGGSDTSVKQNYIIVNPLVAGDTGYFLVHSNVDGADVFFDEELKGSTAEGILLVEVNLTAPPYTNYTVTKDGYFPVTSGIPAYPLNAQTVDIFVVLDQIPSGDVYYITATAMRGGLVSPKGVIPVNAGESVQFNFTALTNYGIFNILIDNQSRGPLTNYTFTEVVSNHTLVAYFTATTGGSGGGGGGGGGGGSSYSTATTRPTTIPTTVPANGTLTGEDEDMNGDEANITVTTEITEPQTTITIETTTPPTTVPPAQPFWSRFPMAWLIPIIILIILLAGLAYYNYRKEQGEELFEEK